MFMYFHKTHSKEPFRLYHAQSDNLVEFVMDILSMEKSKYIRLLFLIVVGQNLNVKGRVRFRSYHILLDSVAEDVMDILSI